MSGNLVIFQAVIEFIHDLFDLCLITLVRSRPFRKYCRMWLFVFSFYMISMILGNLCVVTHTLTLVGWRKPQCYRSLPYLPIGRATLTSYNLHKFSINKLLFYTRNSFTIITALLKPCFSHGMPYSNPLT